MLSRYHYRISFLLLALGLLAAISMTVAITPARAATALTSQMDVGSSGDDVTALQTFLATNSLVYPEGLVTGHYGPLTQTAVAQFQIAYGLPAVGRVGPQTLAKLNSLITAGQPIDVSAPFISNVQVTKLSGSASVSWSTSESTKGVVYYSAQPVVTYEVSKALTEPSSTGVALTDQAFLLSHAVSLSGLQSGQAYYYIIESTDMTGNVSLTLPASFVAQ
ncbi:MAG: peptidoglycan-binding domain-containing protein [Patescibacteria group bacterium]